MADSVEWGKADPSSISAKVTGQCIDFTFKNGYDTAEFYRPLEFEGHVAMVDLKPATQADIFSVIPAEGWDIVSTHPLVVPEWAEGIITVCQMLVG